VTTRELRELATLAESMYGPDATVLLRHGLAWTSLSDEQLGVRPGVSGARTFGDDRRRREVGS